METEGDGEGGGGNGGGGVGGVGGEMNDEELSDICLVWRLFHLHTNCSTGRSTSVYVYTFV